MTRSALLGPAAFGPIAVVLLLFMSACGAEDRERATPWVERDSTGVLVVENRDLPSLRDAGYALSPEPLLSIGSVSGDPEYQFFRVAGGVLLDDGRIVVSNSSSQEIRVYGADGTHLHSFGTAGAGPGEFENPRLLGGLGADSLVVQDVAHRRVSILHVDDGFARSFPTPEGAGGFPIGQGIFADGTQAYGGGLYFSSDAGGFPEGVFQSDALYASVDLEGNSVTEFGSWPSSEMYGVVSDNGFMARSLPFGKGTSIAVGRDRLWIGKPDAYEVHGYQPDGTLTHVLRLDRPPADVTDADVARFTADEIEDADSPNERREFEALMLEMPIPDRMPAFGSMKVDALGHLWVQEYAGPRVRDPEWTIFDPDGHIVGVLRTPDRTQILEIGPDYILGRLSDELDIEYLQVWGLTRP